MKYEKFSGLPRIVKYEAHLRFLSRPYYIFSDSWSEINFVNTNGKGNLKGFFLFQFYVVSIFWEYHLNWWSIYVKDILATKFKFIRNKTFRFYSKLQNALANLIQIIHDAIVAKSFANYLQIETELDLRSTHDSILWW